MNARIRAALLSLCSLVLVVHAPPARAQAFADSSAIVQLVPSDARPAQHVGPTRDALAVGVRPTLSPTTAPAPSRGGSGIGQPEAMMIVGGAAILVGAVIGGDAGDIFMIGGAVVGLVGLYKYLQ
jgi:hypothetical protein